MDIMDHLHKFVPQNSSGRIVPVLCAGDELTCERELNAQEDRRDSATPEKRFEGLVPCISDFHTLGNFMGARLTTILLAHNCTFNAHVFSVRNCLSENQLSNCQKNERNSSSG